MRLAEIAFKSIPARLASLLLQLAEEQGRQAASDMRHTEHAAQGSNTITGLTHQNLGEQIGTYRETTTQTLNLFQERRPDRHWPEKDHHPRRRRPARVADHT